ncbi:MAG: hypothetical protein K0Q57_847, partial [Gammaproteobacteria bacterium]|nr:hypothetical protein [Gammaproteobacteria bacterium]
MPATATFSLRQYHLMMLSFPILILAIIAHRMWPASLNQSLASDGLKLPDGLGLNLSDCKPIIFPATIPPDYTLALTYNGPTSYNCLDNEDSKSCKTDFEKFTKFALNKAPGNRQKLEKARLAAKHKYLSEIELFTSKLTSKQLKRHNDFIQELSLRLKEFIVAEMALNLGLGNCAEFTAIQIAIRLTHPDNINSVLQRITVRF